MGILDKSFVGPIIMSFFNFRLDQNCEINILISSPQFEIHTMNISIVPSPKYWQRLLIVTKRAGFLLYDDLYLLNESI